MQMLRRRFIAFLSGASVLPLLPLAQAHTPYRQWKVMRERFLLVHSYRTDIQTDVLADRIVATFDRLLPKAQARVARARNAERVGSLITTQQAMLAVMSRSDAIDLYNAENGFRGFNKHAIRAIGEKDDYVMISSSVFPEHHAWLVAAAVFDHANPAGKTLEAPETSFPIPLHQGASNYLQGLPLDAGE